MKEKKSLVKIWRVASLLSVIFFILYYYDVKKMIKEDSPKNYVISDVSLRKRYSSSIGINYNNKYYNIGLKKEQVLEYKVGDSISLYHNKKYDYFYVPHTLKLYLIYICASLFSFVLSFIPWMKLKKKMDEYNNK